MLLPVWIYVRVVGTNGRYGNSIQTQRSHGPLVVCRYVVNQWAVRFSARVADTCADNRRVSKQPNVWLMMMMMMMIAMRTGEICLDSSVTLRDSPTNWDYSPGRGFIGSHTDERL